MSPSERRCGPAIEAHFQFLRWLIPTVEKFPRAEKFLLGDRVQSTALDVLEPQGDVVLDWGDRGGGSASRRRTGSFGSRPCWALRVEGLGRR